MKKRALLQIFILALFFVVPLFDIFRIDFTRLHFYVLRKNFSFDDGYILLLTVLVLVFFFVSISKWFGRQFCGWMCPHNTFSGYITKLTHSETLKNNSGLRRAVDIIFSLVCSPIIAYSMIAYFYDPEDLLHEIIHFETSNWSFWAYLATAGFFYMMIGRLRHQFCRSACPYGMLQMILSDKNSRQGGIKNMFRGAGLVLTALMTVMISILLVAIFNSTGFAVSIGKNLEGIPAQNKVIYTYNLDIQNLQSGPRTYQLAFENIPKTWDFVAPKIVKVDANSLSSQSLVFRIDQGSLGTNTNVIVKIKSNDGKEIERTLNIFPIKK